MEIPTNWMAIGIAAVIGASVASVAPAMLRRTEPTRRPARRSKRFEVIDGGRAPARPPGAPGPTGQERVRRVAFGVRKGIGHVWSGWRLGVAAVTLMSHLVLATARWLLMASLLVVAVGAGVWLTGVHWKMNGLDLLSRLLTPAVVLSTLYILFHFVVGWILRVLFGLVRAVDPGSHWVAPARSDWRKREIECEQDR
jgi:hypothetical protein